MVHIKSHKKHTHKKIAHHIGVHEERGHVHVEGKVPKQKHTALTAWKITTLALALLLIFSIATSGFSDISLDLGITGNTVKNKASENALPVELYVMSQCPYGVQAENTMFAAIQELGEENFDLSVEYISTDLGNGEFDSLHGQPETDGNIVQLCAQEVDQTKYLDLILCMNKDMDSIPDNWEACAESLEYDVKAIRECYTGTEGKALLSASAAKATARGATGSPTIYLNDNLYTGGREVLDFKRAFCAAFDEDDQPQTCEDVPAPHKFEVIVLNDKTCASCTTEDIIPATKNFFPGAQIREVDITSSEGKELINTHDIQVVPTYIFAPEVTDSEAWQDQQFQTNFEAIGDGYYKLQDFVTGATYFIDKTKRAERLADMGIVVNDNKPQIDFFVMSYCPYGNQAEEGIVGAYELMKDSAEFKPHYIYYENYGGGGPNYCLDEDNKLCSMHGVVEVRQNVREQCVAEEYGMDAWFDFAIAMNSECDSQNADTCYVAVAEDLGYDVDYIATCEEENAIAFATEDAQLMTLFGASGSPAVYIDGVAYDGPRTATGYQAGLCAAYETAPSFCDDIVVDEQAPAAPEGQC